MKANLKHPAGPPREKTEDMASVVIIHDRSDICDLLCPVIEQSGYTCVAVQSGDAAVHTLDNNDHDLVLLDIDSVNDTELTILSLSQTRSRPDVLAISSGGNTANLQRAIQAGVWDVICTPFTHRELIQAINRCLFHRQARIAAKITGQFRRDAILGSSASLERCLENVATVAQTNASVLILGETGTGKELFAQAIHENSLRTSGHFIVVDCTNIPKTLAESLLFGHERGGFTGANETRDGLFKQADGGTIFLDEIGDLDLDIQKSLLRVLQAQKFRPLSSKREAASNFRLVAATNRDLDDMIARGTFRQDLYHRLRARVVQLPPLRARKEDILPIANYHVRQICDDLGCPLKEVSYELHQALTLYDWPGNIRELINCLHAVVHNGYGEPRLYPQHLPLEIRTLVLPKRNGKAAAEGYLVPDLDCGTEQTEACPTCSGPRHSPCTLSDPLSADPCPPAEPVTGSHDLLRPVFNIYDHDNRLLPLKAVRELAMHEVEIIYLQHLVAHSEGSFQRALTISGLSRARLYDLLNKHSMSIARSIPLEL